MSWVTVADAETSEESFFASGLHHRTERVDDGTNSLNLVGQVVFPVRASQPSDVRRHERSQVSKGKLYVDDDVTVKSKFCKLTTADSIVHVEDFCYQWVMKKTVL